MNKENYLSPGQQRYANLHQGTDAVSRYYRKLDNRIDRLRHTIEIDLLSEELKGSVFDCTIGVGRFIGKLPNVTQYDGMDISREFVNHIQENHPSTRASVGNLVEGIAVDDCSYDNTICLRSLSGIGSLPTILAEMIRITKPGGLVVIDYGRKKTIHHIKGVKTVLDGEKLDEILPKLDASIEKKIYVDAFISRLKRRRRIFNFINSPRGEIVSDKQLLRIENSLSHLIWERQIILLRRHK